MASWIYSTEHFKAFKAISDVWNLQKFKNFYDVARHCKVRKMNSIVFNKIFIVAVPKTFNPVDVYVKVPTQTVMFPL